MTSGVKIRDPRAEARTQKSIELPTLDQLKGKTLAILNNGWSSMDHIALFFAGELRARYGIGDVFSVPIESRVPAEAALIDSIASRADLAIVGLAN